jgi:hypothetical protein
MPMSSPGENSPRSNALFSAIVATVAASGGKLTIRDIAKRVGASESVTAQCIALHRYFRLHADEPDVSGTIAIPTPADFTVPELDEEIDQAGLGLIKTA